MFSHLHVLSLLAQFILRAYVSMSRNRKAPTLPLIVSAPKNPENGTCIILGIPPLCEDSPKRYRATLTVNLDLLIVFLFAVSSERPSNKRRREFDAMRRVITSIHHVNIYRFMLVFY